MVQHTDQLDESVVSNVNRFGYRFDFSAGAAGPSRELGAAAPVGAALRLPLSLCPPVPSRMTFQAKVRIRKSIKKTYALSQYP